MINVYEFKGFVDMQGSNCEKSWKILIKVSKCHLNAPMVGPEGQEALKFSML